jgi:pimeloyl-ACP methyl ester carboxylesterase
MSTVTSKDGTAIAFDKTGQGPALILVLGAFNERATGAPLAQSLAQHFTVFNYDRRGRGESGDTRPYAVEREIEDLDALIQEAGGSAFVFGYSSGAVLALRAAVHGLAITKLALYEPPPTGPSAGNLAAQLAELIASGRRGDAVELFQTEGVGIPHEVVVGLRTAPFRPALEKMAHTLVYEMTILTDETLPPQVAASVQAPVLVMVGTDSPEVMRQTGQAFAEAMPEGQYSILAGQTHDIAPAVVVPLLEKFFAT